MEFVCRVGTSEGQVLEDVFEALDERALRTDLEGRGFHVFRVRHRGLLSRFPIPRLGLRRRKKITGRHLLVFNQQLAALLRSGLPVLQALEMMAERERDPFFRDVLSDVRDQVKTGKELSDAFADHADLFPALFAPTLKAGERTGELEEVLRRFVRYQKIVFEARKRVVSALVYPLVLIGLSVGLIAIMTMYVVPKFTEFFSALGAELPLMTRFTLGLSEFVLAYWPPLILGSVSAWIVTRQWKRTKSGGLLLDRWKLGLPILGMLFSQMAMSEFCRSLSTLLAGGIPMVDALGNSVGAVGNLYIRSKLAPVIRRVREGAALHEALEETGVSPEIATDMIKVGEATGALDEMLNSASDFLDEDVETRMERVLSLLEPIMLVLMGTIVAMLLLSVYLPLFSLLGEVHS